MKLEKIRIENSEGTETADIARADYIKNVVKEQAVKPYETEENGSTAPEKVVTHILKSLEDGKDVDEGIQGKYAELIAVIQADVDRTIASKQDKKKEAEEAKAAKEAEKARLAKEQEEKKLELAKTQSEFVAKVQVGADLAAKEFGAELKQIADALPEGVSVANIGSGYGISFSSDASKETIGQTLGYLMQKGQNSGFVANQIQFWIGDSIGMAVAQGIFITAKEAAVFIAKVVSDSTGKQTEPASLDQYKRMAERTPVEYRNPKADPTAYLALSAMKEPKKGDNETPEAYKSRKDAFEADRAAVQQQLAVGELSKRKEVMPIVNDLLVKHGMKEAVDPNAPVISIGQQLQLFFHAMFGLENLLGVHTEGVAIYKEGDALKEVSESELESIKASAFANLSNALYTNEKAKLAVADFVRGYVEKIVKVEVAKSADGKAIMEDQKVKNLVYPNAFFETPKAETPAETPTEKGEAAEAPAEAPTEKGEAAEAPAEAPTEKGEAAEAPAEAPSKKGKK